MTCGLQPETMVQRCMQLLRFSLQEGGGGGVVRLLPGDPAPSGPPLGPLRRPVERNGGPGKRRNLRPGWAEPRTTAPSWCSVNHPGHHAEQGTWGSHTRRHREAGCGRPEDGGAWTAKTVKRPPQQPAQPQYANYWEPLKRQQQAHRPQWPTQSSDRTQHAKGRTGDCPGPCKETTTRRNVTQGVGGEAGGQALNNIAERCRYCFFAPSHHLWVSSCVYVCGHESGVPLDACFQKPGNLLLLLLLMLLLPHPQLYLHLVLVCQQQCQWKADATVLLSL